MKGHSHPRQRTPLTLLLVVGIASVVLIAVVNVSSSTIASSSSSSAGDPSSAAVILEQRRNAKVLEDILQTLRGKPFVDIGNGTSDEATLTGADDLRAAEKLLERAEELLAEQQDDRKRLHSEQRHASTDIQSSSTASMEFPADHDGSNVHIVFSATCNLYNRRLQQTVLQLTAAWVGQKGPITQILSGCTDEEREQVMLEPTFYYDFRRHFTPGFAINPEPGYEDNYMAYNKPFGLRHFLQNAMPPVKHDAIALIDGDFYFFRPIEINTGRNVSLYYAGSRDRSSINDSVVDGWALAQDWTNVIKGGFYTEEKRETLDKVCGGLPCGNVSLEDGVEYYANIGPPYIMTVNDANRFVDDYCHLCVTSRTVSREWMTEMFAYSVAAANNGIKHTALTNIGISAPRFATGGHEHWEFVDGSMANPCEDNSAFVMPRDPPVAFHACQVINGFYKAVVPGEMTWCERPLLVNLPASDWTDVEQQVEQDYWVMRRQEVWAKCTAIKIMNLAAVEYKRRTCPNGFNTFHGMNLIGK